MSLWDIIDQEAPSNQSNDKPADFHSLISNTESSDLKTILAHHELFNYFRDKDPDLTKFITGHSVFHQILQILINNQDLKLSNRIVELFLFTDSIFLFTTKFFN